MKTIENFIIKDILKYRIFSFGGKSMELSPSYTKLFNIILSSILLTFLYPAYLTAQEPPNTITFDNQAGEYALVKLVGPTLTSIEVPNGEKRTVHAAKGEYYILTRYGTNPNHYKFSKGETFEVTQSKTEYSITTIILYPVIDGNYSTTPITSDEFSKINVKNINWEKVIDGSESTHTKDVVLAAENGNSLAQYVLGIIYFNGIDESGFEKNVANAEFWFCQSAKNGNLKAFIDLKKLHDHHIDKLEINNLYFNNLHKEAKNNDEIAQYRLGVRYEKGINIEENIIEAIKWYQLSANQDYEPAQYVLGNIFFYGKGVEKDFKEAVKWYKKAAENGNAVCQDLLAFMYLNGEGVEKNVKEAIYLLKQSAEQGFSRGQHNLGVMYLNGIGVQKNYEEAAKWFRKSAEQGFAAAQHNLGMCYSVGAGVPVDKKEADKWFEKAKKNEFKKE